MWKSNIYVATCGGAWNWTRHFRALVPMSVITVGWTMIRFPRGSARNAHHFGLCSWRENEAQRKKYHWKVRCMDKRRLYRFTILIRFLSPNQDIDIVFIDIRSIARILLLWGFEFICIICIRCQTGCEDQVNNSTRSDDLVSGDYD